MEVPDFQNELEREIDETIEAEKSKLGIASRDNTSAPLRMNSDAPAQAVERPVVRDDLSLPEKTEAVLAAIASTPSASFVLHVGTPARVVVRDGRPVIEPYDRDMLRGVIARTVQFVRNTRNTTKMVDPSKNVLDDLLHTTVYPAGIPVLRRIAQAPVLTADGDLVAGDGLDAETGVYFHMDKALRNLTLPETIGHWEIEAARQTLLEVFLDFPFATPVDQTNMCALLFATALRHLIDGPTPLFVIDGNQPGVGKGLLLKLICLIVFGHADCFGTARLESEELRKRLFALLREGTPFHVLDNIDAKIWQGTLAAHLTANSMRDRVLGESQTESAPNRMIIAATGNNVQVGGDIARRCVYIRLHSTHPRPHERSDFTHVDVCTFTLENRAEILRAIYVIAAGWIRAGKPAPDKTKAMGSFESFVRVTAGIVEHAGFPGVPFDNRDQFTGRDEDAEDMALMLQRAREKFGDKPFFARELAGALDPEEVPDRVTLQQGGQLAKRLGRLLKHIEGRPYGLEGLVVQVYGKQNGTYLFVVRPLDAV